jgi:cytochrome c-type biogenesis protein
MSESLPASISLVTAFVAGVISFISPCVLPIVPGYLSFISGVNVAQLKDQPSQGRLARRVGLTSAVFVLGFSTVFVALGATASVLGQLLEQYKRELGIVGGLVIIVLGVHTAGIIQIPWLLYERRAEVRSRPVGLLGAYVVGLAFAFGWTPCIGPILAMILGLAASQESMMKGVLLLVAYSLGLGIPFIVSGVAINAFFAAFGRIRRHMRLVEWVAGGLLILVGILLVSGRLSDLARWFSRLFPFLMTIG